MDDFVETVDTQPSLYLRVLLGDEQAGVKAERIVRQNLQHPELVERLSEYCDCIGGENEDEESLIPEFERLLILDAVSRVMMAEGVAEPVQIKIFDEHLPPTETDKQGAAGGRCQFFMGALRCCYYPARI